MGRRKNTEVIVQTLIFLGIAVMLLYGMLSGKVNYYVHPRFHVGIWISIIVLILFAVSLLSNLTKGRHNVNLSPYMIFVIPLFAALIFPATKTTNTDMVMADIRNSADSNTENTKSEESYTQEQAEEMKDSNLESSSIDSDSMDGLAGNQEGDNVLDKANDLKDIADKYSGYEIDGITVIEGDVFGDWYFDVYDNLDYFIGKRHQFLAQVYSMEGLENNQFLAGRYFMVCCAADLVGYGIICESDSRGDLVEDQWITVTGTIAECEYDGSVVPMLTDVKIAEAQAPEVEYVYFNSY